MTNKEFYGDKLLAIALEDYCHDLHIAFYNESCVGVGKKCEDCEFSSVESIENWLNAEHVKPEPPLLKNGDGLKPGDWIMVSDDDDSVIWYKNRFVCYYNATFFVVDDIENDTFNKNGTNITGWKYARLPEDGE